jgi:hypothetical protein
MIKQRKFRFKGTDPGKEQKNFWLAILIALLLGAVIYYL